ncbi:MAG: dTMP kinase [Candidatus Acidiferrales bacterium]
MTERGKFIVLEGIDGSGKRTQMEMLLASLTSRGIACTQVSFPRYSGFFGKMVAQYLNGEFGALESVDAHFSALLYAGDRLEAKEMISSELAKGSTVLADRYIGSNLAHQGARVPAERREGFLRWLEKLEYEVYELPVEDLVIYLRVPAAEAQRLVSRKGEREYTKRQRDLQEENLAHLEAAAAVYDELARGANWVKIECYDAKRQALRTPEEIHREVEGTVEARLGVKRAAR